MQRCFLFFFSLPNLCCLSKCKAVQQPTGMMFYCMKQGVDCMTCSEVCGWLASCDRAGRLQRVKEMGSTAVPTLLLAGDNPVCPIQDCAQATQHGLAAHLQLISRDDHQASRFPGPTMSVSTIRATEVSWCLFKHQGWSLDVQQEVPPVCQPLNDREGRPGGLGRSAMAKVCGCAIPQFHQGPSQPGVLQGRLSLPWARAPSLPSLSSSVREAILPPLCSCSSLLLNTLTNVGLTWNCSACTCKSHPLFSFS